VLRAILPKLIAVLKKSGNTHAVLFFPHFFSCMIHFLFLFVLSSAARLLQGQKENRVKQLQKGSFDNKKLRCL